MTARRQVIRAVEDGQGSFNTALASARQHREPGNESDFLSGMFPLALHLKAGMLRLKSSCGLSMTINPKQPKIR